jgi:putative ABC transport system substrate-binding protein
VASYNRPGGNVTGVSFFGGSLGAKRLELLHHLVPAVNKIALLEDPRSLETQIERADLKEAARSIGAELFILDASSDHDIETAFATFVARRASALICGAGAFFHSHRVLSTRRRWVALRKKDRRVKSVAVRRRRSLLKNI